MKPARDLTGPQLRARLDTLSARLSALSSELIAASRGTERPSETAGKDDPLSVRFNETSAAYIEASDERSRRVSWGGTLRPIARQA